MKNTVRNAIGDGAAVAASRSDRWKALPFLVLMFTSSLPLNYRLEESHPMLVSDVADLTREAAAGENTGSSLLFVAFVVALYAMSGMMVLHKPRVAGAVLRRQWPLVLLTLLVAASALWSHNPEKVLMNVVHGLGAICITMAAALHYRHDPWAIARDLALVLGVNMLLHVGAVLAIPSYSIDWQGRWQGLATHPNTLGALGFTTLWANSAVLICRPRERRAMHAVFALAAIAAIAGADSVTSMLTAGSSVVALWSVHKLGRLGAGRDFYVGTVLLALLLVVGFKLVSSQIDLGWLFQSFGRDSNFTGRTDVWRDALGAISRFPILGWSFDDHAFLIASEGLAYPSYHNGWLDLCVNGGLVAVLLLAGLFATWLRQFSVRDVLAQTIAPLSASFVLGYFLHNLTEASFLSPRAQMWQIFLAVLFLGSCRRPAPTVLQAQPQPPGTLPFDKSLGARP